ncbi:amino acid ABC transporter permease [Aliidongia dinghuensis]|nr:amino acid ABC transporter permease [Aliidongia dinghuensis]
MQRGPAGLGFLSSWLNVGISILAAAFLLWLLVLFGKWAFWDSAWSDAGADPCGGASGACWAVIGARYRLILFGLYPYEEQWRSLVACLVVVAMVAASCVPRLWRAKWLIGIWISGFTVFIVLMQGGVFGLSEVTTERWGGLSLTLFIYTATIIIGMPLSVLLAIMRCSDDRVLRFLAGVVVDFIRSIPLLAVVFGAAIFAPFVLPGWLNTDNVYRVILGFALFFAAYQSTILQAGIQSVGLGQGEAARALGLTPSQGWWLVILPQAFRKALPATINQLVSTFKDTSVLVIVGLFELMASAKVAIQTGKWSDYYIEVYVFVALIYFAVSYSLTRYGAYLEARMRVGQD